MAKRIAIVGGGGGVGSSLAFNLLVRPEPYDVGLVDGHSGRARSHEMDLQQVVAAGATGSISVVGPDAIVAADVVVIAAAAPLTLNRSRMVYLRDNLEIVRTVTAAITADWPGTIVMVTNPVDPLCTWLRGALDIDRRRIVGYTANDSLRLRTAIGDLLGVPPGRVDAWVLGEHGDACVPLLDRVRVDGAPVALSAEQQRAAAEFVRGWYVRHVALDSGRSSTWSSGLGVSRRVAAIAVGAGEEAWPASLVLGGEYGIEGVALSVPVALGRGGAERVHEWDLAEGERRAMREAADVVREAVERLSDSARA
jgi:malate/lactate dehydrogenase